MLKDLLIIIFNEFFLVFQMNFVEFALLGFLICLYNVLLVVWVVLQQQYLQIPWTL